MFAAWYTDEVDPGSDVERQNLRAAELAEYYRLMTLGQYHNGVKRANL